MFITEITVKLADTDAAGVLFYGSYMKLAHEAYESFMEGIEFSLKHIISKSDFLLLIIHCEADFKKPMRLGDKYSITLKVENIGETSFVLDYSFTNTNAETLAVMKTVHVAIKKKNDQKIKLPENLRESLSKHV